MRPTSSPPVAGSTSIVQSISMVRSSTSCGLRTRWRGCAGPVHPSADTRPGPAPVEVTTDRAPVYPRVLDEHASGARHILEQYPNNVVEADHGRLKARLRPMR